MSANVELHNSRPRLTAKAKPKCFSSLTILMLGYFISNSKVKALGWEIEIPFQDGIKNLLQ